MPTVYVYAHSPDGLLVWIIIAVEVPMHRVEMLNLHKSLPSILQLQASC